MQLPRSLGGVRQGIFVRLVVNGILQAGAMIGSALLIQQIVDRYIVTGGSGTDLVSLWQYAAALVIAGLFAAGLRMLERIDAERLGQSYAFSARRRMFDQLSRLAPRVLASRRHGDIMLRFVGDLGAMRRWLSMGLARLASSGLLIAITCVVLLALNWPLGLTVYAALAAAAVLTLLIGPPLEAAIREVRRRRTFLADNVAEKTSAMIVVQAHGQIEQERQRLRRQSRKVRQTAQRRATLVGALRGASEISVRLSVALALFIGAYQVAAGQATAGTVVAAMGIVAFLAAPIRDLSRVYDYWHAARVSQEKLANFLAEPRIVAEPRRPRPVPEGPGQLEFRDVVVNDLFASINGTAEPGKLTVLTGPNGSGKSTLIWLAARLLDPDAGRIVLDGRNIAKVALDELRQKIGIVSNDIPLVKGTVDKNLRYRCPAATSKQVDAVYELCEIDSLVADLPAGRHARVTAGGRNLSAGQRQRIMLARALLGGPRLLLLDEPDVNLDAQAREIFSRVIKEFSGTILMATHDSNWLAKADTVWQIADGKLDSVEPAAALRLRVAGGQYGG